MAVDLAPSGDHLSGREPDRREERLQCHQARVATDALPKPLTLNDVICWYLAARGRREEAYARVRSIMRDADFAPPLALRQLAAITDFDLFVTTTFDPLLERAVNEVRFAGAQSVEVVAYSPNRVADIPVERERLTRPVVYHLLGRLSASPTYVVSDEDMLEFICALQSEHLTPEKLFHELEHNHLLFIGSSFTNWLARLFLRMAKRRRLSDPRDVGEVLADSHSGRDTRLMGFLQQVSVRTRVYSGAQKFVDELHRRWTTRRGPGEEPRRPDDLGRDDPARALAEEDRPGPEHDLAVLGARGDAEALHLGVPTIGWNHGGVQETLAAMFPAGAVTPGDRRALLERSREFLRRRPTVAPSGAYGLRESMQRTLAVYRSALAGRNQGEAL